MDSEKSMLYTYCVVAPYQVHDRTVPMSTHRAEPFGVIALDIFVGKEGGLL